MKRVILGACIALVAFGCQPKTEETAVDAGAAPAPAATGTVAFATLADVMKTSCVKCHGSAKPAEGLDLTSYEGLMKGGEHGPVVVPGDPAASRLVKFLRGQEKPQMPLKAAPLPEETIQAVETWIKEGAKA